MEINVPLSELLSEKFFQEYTPYSSFEAFLAAGGFHPETKDDIEAIPEADIDAHVSATTRFSSWHDLMETALQRLLIG